MAGPPETDVTHAEIPMSRVSEEVRAGHRSALLGRSLATSFLTSGGIQAINVLTGVVLARVLGPEGRGELAAVLLWPYILVTLGSLGAVDAAAYYAARGKTDRRTLVGTTLIIGLAQSVLLVGIGVGIVTFALGDYRDSTVRAAYLMLAFIPLNLTGLYLMWLLSGFQRLGWFQVLRLTTIVVAAVVLVGLALSNELTVLTAALAYLLASVATLVGAAALVQAESGISLRFRLPIGRALLGFGLRSHVSNVSSTLNERLDQLLISVFLQPRQLGLYVIAVTLSSATTLVGHSVYLVALPAVAGLEAGKARAASVRRLISLTFIASTVVSVPIIVFAPTLIEMFFGGKFLPAANVSRVLVVAAIAFSMNRALGAVLKGIGRPLDPGVAEIVALGATLAGLAVLLPVFGLMGAAVASLGAYVVSTIFMVRRLMGGLSLSPAGLLLPDRSDVERVFRLVRSRR
jgi:O-antigen/teichoic acid export membrane protein